ncbi:hypothetical protein G7Z17_g1635 [Cylindrodendrum hubeiense]|uniref:Uncharacterized protein n=1 Tax=Cylindrodendrum hubeiense TaxID=595255 RepID=A0A9P5HJ23_9HYPO|nr:hypothetical protein G7Z17_g1635 [Cylindrodendrum hubeiense]
MAASSAEDGLSYQRSRTGCTAIILNRFAPAARKTVQDVSVASIYGSSITLIHHQTWCTSAKTLSFVDEGQALQSIYESRSESELEDDTTTSLASERVDILPALPHLASVSTNLDYQNVPKSTSIDTFFPIPRLGAFTWIPSDDGHQEQETPGLIPSDITINDQPPLYRDVSMWPLANANEANLVRYYIDHVSRIFDVCDPERHFSLVVPWRAATCPPLMDAVLALSARWLSRSTNFDEYVADRYQQRCLNIPLSGADSGTHLFGGHLFVSASASDQSPTSASQKPSELSSLSGLRQAAFRVAFRQEVITAFVSQRPVTPAFYLKDVIRSVDVPTDDCTWCHRILLHLADALQFCFPDSSVAADESAKRYEELVAYGDQWYIKTPQSFRPIFFKEANRNSPGDTGDERTLSPDIWLLSDTVATALLNYHLSRILLLAFDPRTPRLGPSRVQFMKRQNQEIKQEGVQESRWQVTDSKRGGSRKS